MTKQLTNDVAIAVSGALAGKLPEEEWVKVKFTCWVKKAGNQTRVTDQELIVGDDAVSS